MKEMSSVSHAPFPCVECPSTDNRKFPTIEELEVHVASDHLNFCPYECEKCRFAKFPTEYALISHCKTDHGLKEFFVRYRYTKEGEKKMAELRNKMRNCIRARSAQGGGSVDDNIQPPSNLHTQAQAHSSVNNIPNGVEKFEEENGDSFPSSVEQMNGVVELNMQNGVTFPAGNGDLSPTDFANDILSGGVDYAAMMGGGDTDETPEKPGKKTRPPKDIVICQVCGLKVSNQRSSLVYHANTKHIKLNLYSCAICQKTWQTIAKSDVVKHVKAVHNGDESHVIDNRKKLGYQLRVFTARCFPPKPSKKHPMTHGCSPARAENNGQEQTDAFGMPMNSDTTNQILNSFFAPKEEGQMEGMDDDNADLLDDTEDGCEDNSQMQSHLEEQLLMMQQQQRDAEMAQMHGMNGAGQQQHMEHLRS